MTPPEQLPLPLPRRAALGREDYFVSTSNALALALLDGWRDWPSGKLILVGPRGAGKTHLAHVWAADSGAHILPADVLPDLAIPDLVRAPLCIEDVPAIAGNRVAEEALFHLHNLSQAERQPLLLTASAPPRHWPLVLADLQSRMEATQTATLPQPDDVLLAAVLAKLLDDRLCIPAPEVIPYLVRHMPRSFAMAQRMAAELDARALGRPKGITRTLARDVLQALVPGS
ncbi:chromosomal replication initiator DnaA [Salipiger marinus]|uniref:DnaA/Hda family protein n=1 Tax=Salipiger marinus TaxID=555512 RepID=UPI001E52275A|nr:chromosomal replication initiator DnaA [Salipiger manganoxidans]MCD1617683.1 chromosomal replication initiator DnaA [Salipiger manganoxidans]MEB3418215.1 chromosomal replication initiator DnaA [Salipiger manganoxidans]